MPFDFGFDDEPSAATAEASDTDDAAATSNADDADADESVPAPSSGPERPRRKKARKPAVPAWEDVLLGVRSNGNS